MVPQNLKLPVYAAFIFILYFYYGILQEKITRATYGEDEKFTYTLALVFFQCIVNTLFAKASLLFFPKGEDNTRPAYYASSSLTYLLAMVASNMALQWVPYPTQVVGKSCKPIPVMVLGVLVAGKRYPLRKYGFVLLIVIGVVLFIFKDGKAGATSGSILGFGEVLLMLSLSMDGLTGAIQDKMRAEHRTSGSHMMYSMNLWSVGYLAAAMVLTGELFTFLPFVQRYPYVLTSMLTFSVCSALGQNFIFLMVSEFGPLPCSITTTTRKFFTVLGSVLFFGNSLSARQWLGATVVFTGLTLDVLYGKTRPAPAVVSHTN